MKKFLSIFSRAGMELFPLAAGSKEPACMWRTEATSDIGRLRQLFSGTNATGYGIATGKRSGIVVIDVDTKDGKPGVDEWDSLCSEHDYTPDTLTVVTASGGFHYYYTYPELLDGLSIRSSAGTLASAIDVRANGGYVVGPGSKTNTGEHSILEQRPIEELPEWLTTLLANASDRLGYGPMQCTEEERADIVDALKYISAENYDTWITCGMACQLLNLFDVWNEWSTTANNYGGEDVCRKHWESFSGGGVGPETIYYLARQNGWTGRREAIEAPPETAKSVIRNIEESTIYNDMPAGLTSLYEHFLNTQAKPQPGFAVMSSLAVVSVCAARRFRTSERNYSSMFFAVLGESGCGKESAISQIKNALDDANVGRVYCGGYQSAGALLSELLHQPAHIALIDELGKHLSSSASNQNKADALTTLMELFSKCDSSYTPMSYSMMSELMKRKGGDEQKSPEMFTVYHPGVSLFGATTPETFYNAMSRGMVSDGFASRLLVYKTSVGRQKRLKGRYQALPDELAGMLWEIRHGGPRSVAAFNEFDSRPVPSAVGIDVDALAVFDRLEDYILAAQNELGGNIANILNRTVEKAMRVATICAVADDSCNPVVTKTIARWACKYVTFCDQNLLSDVRDHVADNGTERDKKMLLSIIRASGEDGVSYSVLTRNTKWLSRAARQDYLSELVESGEIDEIMKLKGEQLLKKYVSKCA